MFTLALAILAGLSIAAAAALAAEIVAYKRHLRHH